MKTNAWSILTMPIAVCIVVVVLAQVAGLPVDVGWLVHILGF